MKPAFYTAIILAWITSGELLAKDKPKPAKTDLELLQGTWVWDPEMEQQVSTPQYDVEKVIVKGEKLTIQYLVKDKRYSEYYELKVRPENAPKEIDFKNTVVERNDHNLIGIYELTESSLKICYRGQTSTRPASFQDKSTRDRPTVYLYLKK